MDYSEKLLARGEKVRRVSRPHLLGMARMLGRRLLQLAACVVVIRLIESEPVDAFLNISVLADFGIDAWLRPIPEWIRAAASAVGGVVLFFCLVDGLRWRATRFVLTDQRVLQFRGVLVTLIIDAPLDQVTDVTVRQSVLGHLLDYGNLVVRTAADDEGRPMAAMKEPFAFRQALEARRQMRVFEAGGATTPGPATRHRKSEAAAPATPIEAVRRQA